MVLVETTDLRLFVTYFSCIEIQIKANTLMLR
uniref:Uncharacterized protein n=1 Tax=Podoviridae sp. ctZkC8 TaxID=2825259 RepID=A0A8S5UBZ4_9CAUD|nr:MAG TPA: hypothetical protein [Podoviridae sp. ctZkC8]